MSYRKLEHLSANFGNLNLSSRGGQQGTSTGGGGGSSSSGGTGTPTRQWNSNNNSNENGKTQQDSQGPPPQQGGGGGGGGGGGPAGNSAHQDWQQLESELNAATAKEFVPGRSWRNQHSSASSVASSNSSSQRKFSSSFRIDCWIVIKLYSHSILILIMNFLFQQNHMQPFLELEIDLSNQTSNSNNSSNNNRRPRSRMILRLKGFCREVPSRRDRRLLLSVVCSPWDYQMKLGDITVGCPWNRIVKWTHRILDTKPFHSRMSTATAWTRQVKLLVPPLGILRRRSKS